MARLLEKLDEIEKKYNETKEQYYKRMMFELSLVESLFGERLAEIKKKLDEELEKSKEDKQES